MSEEVWAALTGRDKVLFLAVLGVVASGVRVTPSAMSAF